MKRCSVCKETKEFSEFHKGNTKSGFASACKKCRKIQCDNYIIRHPDKRKKSICDYNHKHKKQKASYIKVYRASQTVRDSINTWKRGYKKLDTVRKKNAFYERSRQASKLHATPEWIDRSVLKAVYEKCPDQYEVDHIIPLKHSDVCGLHVPWNLQYLTKSDNSSKGNSFDGTNDNLSWKNNGHR